LSESNKTSWRLTEGQIGMTVQLEEELPMQKRATIGDALLSLSFA